MAAVDAGDDEGFYHSVGLGIVDMQVLKCLSDGGNFYPTESLHESLGWLWWRIANVHMVNKSGGGWKGCQESNPTNPAGRLPTPIVMDDDYCSIVSRRR